MTYLNKLTNSVKSTGSTLCIGIDPDVATIHKITGLTVIDFCKTVIEQTSDYCAAYKPNLGFFEALGAQGFEILQQICEFIPEKKIIIADAKRGDIGSTAEKYKTAYFDHLNADAITLNPLMGFETLKPFLEKSSKGIYVLTMTSNPGADDFFLKPFEGEKTLSEHIAKQLSTIKSASSGQIGMVIGATRPDKINSVITKFPDSPLLIPGVGAQGGDIKLLEASLYDHKGIPLINVTRSILYSGDTSNWRSELQKRAQYYKNELSAITSRYV